MNDKLLQPQEPSGLRRFLRPGPILLALIIFVSLVFLVFRKNQPDADPLPLAWFIMGAAVFGSIVNQPFRSDFTGQGTDLAGYLIWKAGVAVVFAMLLHLVFMAGLLEGPLFPKYSRSEDAFVDMAKFVLIVDPKTYADAAKVVVWSFIAGYSEKFVPNLIARLADRASKHGEDNVASN